MRKETWKSLSDKTKYPTEDSNWANTFDIEIDKDNVVVNASAGDPGWTSKSRKNPLIELRSDGNGLIFYKKGKKRAYIDYAESHDLMLALNLLFREWRTGQLVKVKK